MINMKKGIATETTILILIGILVIAIMAYLIYKAATAKALSMYECKSKLMDICRMCKNTNWDASYNLTGGSNDMFNTIITPCSKYGEFFYWVDNKCCGNDPPLCAQCGCMENDCTSLMGPT
jgi:hypothetical protein